MTSLRVPLSHPDHAARWRVSLLALVFCTAATASAAASTAGDFRNSRTYVDAHNAVRADVQKPADYAGRWEPVPPVDWSDEVASTAQDWAEHLRDTNKCKLMHSDTRYGENLAGGKGIDAARAVKMWASERDNYVYSSRYAFEPAAAHYTQLVWRKTTHIGCGIANCGRQSVVVCRYSPAGNHIDKSPY